MSEVKIIGTKELAKRHNVDPKFLRQVLRSQPGAEADHKRYEWKENDPELKKIPEQIAKFKANRLGKGKSNKPRAAKKSAAKTSPKKATPAKKSSPKKAAKKDTAPKPDSQLEQSNPNDAFEEI